MILYFKISVIYCENIDLLKKSINNKYTVIKAFHSRNSANCLFVSFYHHWCDLKTMGSCTQCSLRLVTHNDHTSVLHKQSLMWPHHHHLSLCLLAIDMFLQDVGAKFLDLDDMAKLLRFSFLGLLVSICHGSNAQCPSTTYYLKRHPFVNTGGF